MKNFFYSKAPIITLMVCFFIFLSPYNNANAMFSEDLSNEDIRDAHKCTLTIDANKHIVEDNKFAKATGVCKDQIQGFYQKATDSFNIDGNVVDYVNFDGEQFDFVIEPEGELAIATVKLIEPKKATTYSKARKKNAKNFKEEHQTNFDDSGYLGENLKDENVVQEKTVNNRQADKEKKLEKSTNKKSKIDNKDKEKKDKSWQFNYSIIINILLIIAIVGILFATYIFYKKLRIKKGL